LRRHADASYGRIVKGHDVITIRAIIDSGDPRWIWRAGESDRDDQNQCHDDGKERGDPYRTERQPRPSRIC